MKKMNQAIYSGKSGACSDATVAPGTDDACNLWFATSTQDSQKYETKAQSGVVNTELEITNNLRDK